MVDCSLRPQLSDIPFFPVMQAGCNKVPNASLSRGVRLAIPLPWWKSQGALSEHVEAGNSPDAVGNGTS